MSNEENNELGAPDKIIDMGDLYGNPIETTPKETNENEEPDIDLDDIELSEEEEEMLRKKIEEIRKSDPFIYR